MLKSNTLVAIISFGLVLAVGSFTPAETQVIDAVLSESGSVSSTNHDTILERLDLADIEVCQSLVARIEPIEFTPIKGNPPKILRRYQTLWQGDYVSKSPLLDFDGDGQEEVLVLAHRDLGNPNAAAVLPVVTNAYIIRLDTQAYEWFISENYRELSEYRNTGSGDVSPRDLWLSIGMDFMSFIFTKSSPLKLIRDDQVISWSDFIASMELPAPKDARGIYADGSAWLEAGLLGDQPVFVLDISAPAFFFIDGKDYGETQKIKVLIKYRGNSTYELLCAFQEDRTQQ